MTQLEESLAHYLETVEESLARRLVDDSPNIDDVAAAYICGWADGHRYATIESSREFREKLREAGTAPERFENGAKR